MESHKHQNGPSQSQSPGAASTTPVAKESSQTQLPPASIPNDETDEETRQRLNDEAEAKRRSKLEHQRRKILLLGQAESGKSTILKNFRLRFDPKALESEAKSGDHQQSYMLPVKK